MSHKYGNVGPGKDNSLIDDFDSAPVEPNTSFIEADQDAPPQYTLSTDPICSRTAPSIPNAVPLAAGASKQDKMDLKSHMFQMSFYSRFFNLDSSIFFEKLRKAFNPLDKSLVESNDDSQNLTELYGFIWITGTLIVLMFMSSTGAKLLSGWLYNSENSSSFEYNSGLLSSAICLFYGYTALFPLIYYFVAIYMLKFPDMMPLTKIISIFGYTNILWFPITILNVTVVTLVSSLKHHLMLTILEWGIVLFSGIITGLSNISKLLMVILNNSQLIHGEDTKSANKLYYFLVGLIVVSHMIFTLSIKIIFFGLD